MERTHLANTRNVQAVVPSEVHRVLREIAYEEKKPLRDLLREILVNYTKQYSFQSKAA